MTSSTVQGRIASLTRLIDHPKTRSADKRVAEVMRAGLQARHPEGISGEMCGQTEKLTLTKIANLVRADINVAMKAARLASTTPAELAEVDPFSDVPAGVKVDVTIQHYSDGELIDILIRNVPSGWAWTRDEVNGYERDMTTPAARAFCQALTDIQMSYGPFYGNVTIDSRSAV